MIGSETALAELPSNIRSGVCQRLEECPLLIAEPANDLLSSNASDGKERGVAVDEHFCGQTGADVLLKFLHSQLEGASLTMRLMPSTTLTRRAFHVS